MGDDRVNGLRARADAYRLIGIFLQLPTPEVAEAVDDGAILHDLATIAEELGFRFMEGAAPEEDSQCPGTDDTLFALRHDYTSLFTNPERPLVAVYESSLKESGDFDTSRLLFVSPTAIHAESAYRELGLSMASGHRNSPDHMGAELDFMCYLYDQLADAETAGDGDRQSYLQDKLDAFKREHFMKWARAFFAAVEGSARTSTYRMLGAFGSLLAGSEA